MVRRQVINPFYPIVVVAGILFCITAFAYGVMTVRQLHEAGLPSAGKTEGFTEWIDRHGVPLMIGEVIVLGLCTVAAMATDHLCRRKNHPAKVDSKDKETTKI